MKGLDAWITSGRYSREYLLVECSHCHENTVVKAEQEYGSVWWTPESCSYCGKDFDDDVMYQEYFPEEEI
jgi:hypothetical protein